MKPKRQEVWNKTNGHCWYCGVQLIVRDEYDPNSRLLSAQWFVIDHVTPRTLSGDHDMDNLVPACLICNSTKNNKTLEQYRLYIAMREVGMPYFTREQIAWLESQGFKFVDVEPIQFWAEQQRGKE